MYQHQRMAPPTRPPIFLIFFIRKDESSREMSLLNMSPSNRRVKSPPPLPNRVIFVGQPAVRGKGEGEYLVFSTLNPKIDQGNYVCKDKISQMKHYRIVKIAYGSPLWPTDTYKREKKFRVRRH